MIISYFLKFATVALLGTTVLTHPMLSPEELVDYHAVVARHTEALGRCLEAPHMQEINARMLDHRRTTVQRLRKARGIEVRDDPSCPLCVWDKEALLRWIKQEHEHKEQSKDPQDLWHLRWSDPAKPNTGGCGLAPETIYGPYWIDGQPERQDIRAGQKGIYMRLAMQVIDVATCMPVPNVRVDVWQANAMGQYGPKNTSFLRGWQRSSEHGTVDFDANYPGHYRLRTTHTHVVVRENNGHAAHVGMLYFDDKLDEVIQRTPEYVKNPEDIVKNAVDSHNAYSASPRYDPFVQWSWLGKKTEDGVLAWIAVGINLTEPLIEQPPPKPNQALRKRSLLDDHLDYSI